MPEWISSNLRAKLKPLAIAALLFWLPVVLLARIAAEVSEREPIPIDNAILHWIHAHSSHALDAFFLAVTTVGNAEIITPLALLIVAFMWYRRRSDALILLFGFFGANTASAGLKLLFARERPAFWHSAITETSYSFPSGHAMASSALALSVIAVLWNTRWRWLALVGGGLFMGLIGFSRLYLGVHYPTDVIAGWMASLAWVVIVTKIIRGYVPREESV